VPTPVSCFINLRKSETERALLADLRPINLLEAAQAIGEESLLRRCVGGIGEVAFLLSGGAFACVAIWGSG